MVDENENENNQYYWSKKVIIAHCISEFTIQTDSETREYIPFLFKLMKQNGSINAIYLYEKFGFDKSLGANLLKNLHKDYSQNIEILNSEEYNNSLNRDRLYGVKYTLKNKDLDISIKNLTMTPKITTQYFSVCLTPTLFIDKYHLILDNNPDCKIANSELDILNTIIKLKDSVSDPILSNFFQIPSKYHEISSNDGLYIRGLDQASLKWQNNSFKIFKKHHFLANIHTNHPDLVEINKNLLNVKNNKEILINSLQSWLKSEIEDMIKYVEIILSKDETTAIFIININSSLKDDENEGIGKIYTFYRSWHMESHNFPVSDGWYVNLALKIKIYNSSTVENFRIFSVLGSRMDESYLEILKTTRSQLIDQINSIWNENIDKSHQRYSKTMTEHKLLKWLPILINQKAGNWFSIIYGKLMEDEIF